MYGLLPAGIHPLLCLPQEGECYWGEGRGGGEVYVYDKTWRVPAFTITTTCGTPTCVLMPVQVAPPADSNTPVGDLDSLSTGSLKKYTQLILTLLI